MEMVIITADNYSVLLVQCLDSDSGQYQLLDRRSQELSKEIKDFS